MAEGPRFNDDGEPYFDDVGQPLVCEDAATVCCDPCVAFLACLLKRKFVFRSDGAPLIDLLDKYTHQFVITSGTADTTDAGNVEDLSTETIEKMFCLSGSPAVLLGFGQYEHFDENRTRTVFDGSFVLEPIADAEPFDINDDGSDDVPTLCSETHLAEWPQLLWLIPARTPCLDDFDPSYGGFGEPCDTRPRSMPVRLGLKITCTGGMLTFTIVLLFHRHYWIAQGDQIVDVETGDLDDGTYGCPCIYYYCLDWLTSAAIDLSTTTPADLVDVALTTDSTPTDCEDAFADVDPVATLSMVPADCDLIQDCSTCPPPESDDDHVAELVEIDFTWTASGDQPTEGAMAFFHAVIPDCLTVDPEDIIWSFGSTGEYASHLLTTPCDDTLEGVPDPTPTFCEMISLTVIDSRGCIYKVTKLVYGQECNCPDGDGTLSIDVIDFDPISSDYTYRFTAAIFDCATGFIELQGGENTADCGEVENCDCSNMQELEECVSVEDGFCVFALGDGQTFDLVHSQTLDERQCWRWRFWDGPCGCVGPWNYFEIVGTFEGNPDSRGCGDTYW